MVLIYFGDQFNVAAYGHNVDDLKIEPLFYDKHGSC